MAAPTESSADLLIVSATRMRMCAEVTQSRGNEGAAALFTFAADQLDKLIEAGCLEKDAWLMYSAGAASTAAKKLMEGE